MIVDCETRLWDLRTIDMQNSKIAEAWDRNMEHGRILTGERAELNPLRTGDDLVAMMDACGIDHACAHSPALTVTVGDDFDPQALLIDAMHRHPDRITGYAFTDPRKRGAIGELARLAEAGFRAISIYPPDGFYPDERALYPYYEACLANGIRTLFVHLGLTSMPSLLIKYAHPLHIDAVARDFPELNIVAEHFAYPWERDLIAVAWRHPNVYICCTYLAAMLPWAPGDLHHAYGRALRDIGHSKQIVWGSDWPFWPEKNVSAQLDALREFQIPEDLRDRYGYPEITDEIRADLLGRVAQKLLGLDDR